MKNLSHHGRYGQAGTTTCLVLHYLYDAEILCNCSCPCPGFLIFSSVRMLKYSYTVLLQRKTLMRDPTLAEVGTHNATVSEDKSVSCPPNFEARRLVDAHVTCLKVCNQPGRTVVVPPLFWTHSKIHVTTTYQYLLEKQLFVHNMPSTEPTWWHCI